MGGRRWTPEEDNLIREKYPIMRYDICSLFPDRADKSVMVRANKLGVLIGKENGWTDEEEKILKEKYPIMGKNIQSLLPNRSLNAITMHAHKMGIEGPSTWTRGEDLIIRKHNYMYSDDLLELLPNRSKSSIVMRIQYLWDKHNGNISYPLNIYITIRGTHKGYDRCCKAFGKRVEMIIEAIKNNPSNPKTAAEIADVLIMYYKNNWDLEDISLEMNTDIERVKKLINMGTGILNRFLFKKEEK